MGEILGGLFGGAAGVALALGAMGTTGARHWAVRVLCALAALAVILAGVLVWLFGDRDSMLAVVLDRAMLALLFGAAVLSIAWAWRALVWVHAGGRRRLAMAGAAAAVAVLAWALASSGSTGEPVASVAAGSAVALASPVSTGETVVGVEAMPGACPCGSGPFCVGSRGGHYCIRPNGSKQYIGK